MRRLLAPRAARALPALAPLAPSLSFPARAASSSSPQPVVFKRAALTAQRDAAAARPDAADYDYLRDEVAARLVDRLGDITRDFPDALDLGAHTGNLAKALAGQGGIQRLTMMEGSAGMLGRDAAAPHLTAHPDIPSIISVHHDVETFPWPFPDASFNLVASSMALHWANDLPAILKEVRRVLKPDGVFIASFLGGDTLAELREAFAAADEEREGGMTLHASPMALVGDVGNILAGAGFGLPTIDTDTFQIGYPSAAVLFNHLSRMGESSVWADARGGARADTLLAAAAAYHARSPAPPEAPGEPAGIVATFEVISVIGWAPAPSQPRPLRRGSVPKGFGARGDGPPPEEEAGEKAAAEGGGCCGGSKGCA